MDYFYILDKIIREEIDKGKEIAIYPFGKIAMRAKEILEQRYGRKAILIDNNLAKYNSTIITKDTFLKNYNDKNISIIICSSNVQVNKMLIDGVKDFAGTVRNIKEPPVINTPEKEEFFMRIKELCKVKAVKGFDLIRIGGMHDGGYVMLDDFRNKHVAYSFGIGNDISWDKDIANEGVQVYCYDPTIAGLPEKHKGLEFHKIGITGIDDKEQNLYSMETILCKNSHIKNKHMILKMDVEGAEWDFLKETSSDILDKFSQMTFELHGMTNIENKKIILEVLKKIQKTHTPIWIHANNGNGSEVAGEYQIPILLEITYVNKEEYELEDIEYNCPICLDSPNIDGLYEIELRNW